LFPAEASVRGVFPKGIFQNSYTKRGLLKLFQHKKSGVVQVLKPIRPDAATISAAVMQMRRLGFLLIIATFLFSLLLGLKQSYLTFGNP